MYTPTKCLIMNIPSNQYIPIFIYRNLCVEENTNSDAETLAGKLACNMKSLLLRSTTLPQLFSSMQTSKCVLYTAARAIQSLDYDNSSLINIQIKSNID